MNKQSVTQTDRYRRQRRRKKPLTPAQEFGLDSLVESVLWRYGPNPEASRDIRRRADEFRMDLLSEIGTACQRYDHQVVS